ncbi:hypothetical protein F4778DRAFT_630289 [Xylariomycetidae sp. FL2044]|nr:hypothetical protein F4778DRAFT_630289 [Xylariomycetidae sp. FL2044]
MLVLGRNLNSQQNETNSSSVKASNLLNYRNLLTFIPFSAVTFFCSAIVIGSGHANDNLQECLFVFGDTGRGFHSVNLAFSSVAKAVSFSLLGTVDLSRGGDGEAENPHRRALRTSGHMHMHTLVVGLEGSGTGAGLTIVVLRNGIAHGQWWCCWAYVERRTYIPTKQQS